MTTQFFLTKSGILATSESKSAFFTNTGDFVRECSHDESNYLINEVCLREIEFKDLLNFSELGRWIVNPEMPQWHFLKTIETCQDDSRYRSGTSCNGGDYSFTKYSDFFAMKTLSGEWKFAIIEYGGTSAEFHYDELSMSFQTDLGSVTVENCKDDVSYRTQTYREGWGMADTHEVLEKLGFVIPFEEMWNAEFEYIAQSDADDDESYNCPALLLSDKKEILFKLKEIGWEKPKNEKRKRKSWRRTERRR